MFLMTDGRQSHTSFLLQGKPSTWAKIEENKLYQLCLKEDHPEAYGSVLLSSDFIQES